MNNFSDLRVNGDWIISLRGDKNKVDPVKPYGYLVEKERTISGKVEDTAVIFLTNSECQFQCLMCDLWKNTTDEPVPPGSIPGQIRWALNRLPSVKHLKLYNSGSFFDKMAIPEIDYKPIASLTEDFETLIVESHPRLINQACLRFKSMLKPELQVAIGLETIHPEVLPLLNKKMNLEDFEKAVHFLKDHGISTRAFVLLKPPFLTESEGVYWAQRSIDFAFECGVECCAVIPTRPGNGAMDYLLGEGRFSVPSVDALGEVLEYGIQSGAGRVFADVWDIEKFSDCKKCIDQKKNRLTEMNLSQKIVSRILCEYCGK